MEMKDEIKLKELENEKKRLDNQKELIELVKEFIKQSPAILAGIATIITAVKYGKTAQMISQ